MREIKFRGFDGAEWIYHHSIYQDKADKSIWWILNDNDEWLMCSEPQQYTGLKDKNGKEIYEGDLIKKKFKDREIGEFYAVGQVVFGHWYAGFTVPYNYHGYNKLERLSSSCDKDGWVVANRDMEVIGNIHENPEFLEEAE